MTKRVAVWGTGNVGRPAIRAVLAHRELELVGAVVANPDKVGRDAGELAGVAPAGIIATSDWQSLIRDEKPDAAAEEGLQVPKRRGPAFCEDPQ